MAIETSIKQIEGPKSLTYRTPALQGKCSRLLYLPLLGIGEPQTTSSARHVLTHGAENLLTPREVVDAPPERDELLLALEGLCLSSSPLGFRCSWCSHEEHCRSPPLGRACSQVECWRLFKIFPRSTPER